MPAAAAVAVVAASAYSANKQAKAAKSAAKAQQQSADAGIAEQQRQFDAIQKLMEPYVKSGAGALTGYQDLLGLNGANKSAEAIAALEQSPEFAALIDQGENAILQNASATGGLRGGNTQGALAQYRPAVLSQLINDRYSRLGGLISVGQNAAAGTGNAGVSTGSNIAQLLQQRGAAEAGGALAGGRAQAGYANALANGIGMYFGGLGGGMASMGGGSGSVSGGSGIKF